MSVVGKSTCSGFKTGLYISYHGGKVVRYIKQRANVMKNARISSYFDTKYMAVLRIEQILHNFEDQKFADFFNLEQVNFRVTLIKCPQQDVRSGTSLLDVPIGDIYVCFYFCPFVYKGN